MVNTWCEKRRTKRGGVTLTVRTEDVGVAIERSQIRLQFAIRQRVVMLCTGKVNRALGRKQWQCNGACINNNNNNNQYIYKQRQSHAMSTALAVYM